MGAWSASSMAPPSSRTSPLAWGRTLGVYDSADGYLYVANAGSGNVTVIHGAAAIASIAVGPSPSSEEYDPASDFLYVSNTNTVSVIRGTAVVATLYVGAAPGTPLWDGQNGYVYVPNANSDNVSVINGTTVITSIVVGVNPQPALYDATNGYVYVANEDGIVSAIQGTTLVATIPVSNPSYGWALGMDYDRGSGYLYLPDLYNGSLVIINGTQIVSRVSLPQPVRRLRLGHVRCRERLCVCIKRPPGPLRTQLQRERR